MIKSINKNDLYECAALITNSFMTVADEFGFTPENAPRFTAFATTAERLQWQLEQERRPMFVYLDGEKIIGYYSISANESGCELNNLCVAPQYRHSGIGKELLADAFSRAKKMGYNILYIGIVEENIRLRKWYEQNGFVHTGTKKV